MTANSKERDGTPDIPMGMFLLSYGIPDSDAFIRDFKQKENSASSGAPKLSLKLAGVGACREDGTNTCLIVGTYPRTESNEKAVQETFLDVEKLPYTGEDGSVAKGEVIPPFEPRLSCTLLWDKWEVDPASVDVNEELMIYVGGHGVLSFDKWFEVFKSTRHDQEFPGAIRTLAGEGEAHADGTKTCVFIHIFKKSKEEQVRQLFFGEEKSLVVKEKSIIMPWYPDLYATIGYMEEVE